MGSLRLPFQGPLVTRRSHTQEVPGAGVRLLLAASFPRCLSVDVPRLVSLPRPPFLTPTFTEEETGRGVRFTREGTQLAAEELRFSPTDPKARVLGLNAEFSPQGGTEL